MPIRTRNGMKGFVSNELLGGPSIASGFSDFPSSGHTPVGCKRNYVFETFNGPYTASLMHPAAGGAGGIAPTGAAGDVNAFSTRQNTFEYHILGAGQTILAPKIVATGYDVSLDQTDNDGLEITLGVEDSAASGVITAPPCSFTIGTSSAFFARLKFAIADVSGTDDCAFGFRKAAIYQANIDDYTDAATLNVISGNVTMETILNNAATTATDTTDNWLDTETHTLQVNVSAAGAVTYLLDGVAPTVTAAFTFDSGDVLIPFFYFLQATTSPGIITFKEFECGFQDPQNG